MILKTIPVILTKLHSYLLWYQRNIEIGSGSLVYYKSKIVNKSKLGGVKIGNKCLIGRSMKGYHAGMPFYTALLNDGNDSKIMIGDNCRLNGVYMHAQKEITVGDNCVFASGISVIDSNGHELYSSDRTVGRDEPKPIKIGNNVKIGANATVLKNIPDNVTVVRCNKIINHAKIKNT